MRFFRRWGAVLFVLASACSAAAASTPAGRPTVPATMTATTTSLAGQRMTMWSTVAPPAIASSTTIDPTNAGEPPAAPTVPTPAEAPASPVGGRIAIPAIDLDTEWREGVDDATLALGPGHWPGRPMPGQPGNAVFGGHRTIATHPFERFDELKAGDEVVFDGEAGMARYVVRDVFVVGPGDLWITDPSGPDRVTLFACHPKGSASQRIVVVADRATSAPASDDATATPGASSAPDTEPPAPHAQPVLSIRLPALPGG